ncbi:MAG: Clp protease N-terminal domain-containing protein [Streptosporangiaceae bacterium]
MPKINVYLPDDLAASVRAAGIPVSPICQHALAEAVRSASAVRKAIDTIRSPDFTPASHPDLQKRLDSRMTVKLAEIFSRARQAGGGQAGTAQLLTAVLDHGGNLGVLLLEAVDISLDDVRDRIGPAADPADAGAEGAGGLTREAWRALAAAAEAGIELGHNYLGSEHLILGLLAEPDSAGGQVLLGLGGDPAKARRVLTSMLSAYTYGRDKTLHAGAASLGVASIGEVMRRLDALETQVAALSGTTRVNTADQPVLSDSAMHSPSTLASGPESDQARETPLHILNSRIHQPGKPHQSHRRPFAERQPNTRAELQGRWAAGLPGRRLAAVR